MKRHNVHCFSMGYVLLSIRVMYIRMFQGQQAASGSVAYGIGNERTRHHHVPLCRMTMGLWQDYLPAHRSILKEVMIGVVLTPRKSQHVKHQPTRSPF